MNERDEMDARESERELRAENQRLRAALSEQQARAIVAETLTERDIDAAWTASAEAMREDCATTAEAPNLKCVPPSQWGAMKAAGQLLASAIRALPVPTRKP